MVMAEKMQNAMEQQIEDAIFNRLFQLTGLTCSRGQGNDDIAQ